MELSPAYKNCFSKPLGLVSMYHCIIIGLLGLLLPACHQQQEVKQYIIGFSQCQGGDGWRKTMLDEMKREISFHDNIVFVYKDAAGNNQQQITQIEELVKEKVDLLIVSPNEATPLSPIIKKVYRSGIPVVLVDRRTDSANYNAYVGASNFEVGQDAGRYAVSLLNGQGNLIEIGGLTGASPFIDRHNGFMNIISRYKGIQHRKKIEDHSGNYLKEVENTLLSEKSIDLIFAHSDYIAKDIYPICRKLGLDKKIKIIGIDGLPIAGAGMDMVENKNIVATVLYPTGGQEAIITAVNILEKKPYKKENQLFTTIIDSANVRILKLQNEKVQSQQKDIDRRQQKIERQLLITRSQANTIYTISALLILALLLGAITYYYLRTNRIINRRLNLQKEEIVSQRNELIEVSAKAQAANEAKVNFFTNISHEFRTPLTLILGPLEELLADKKNGYATRQSLTLIQKNVIRLLRLFNQLIDFRKVEVEKMKLRATENDLVGFIAEIIDSYKSIAKKREIDLRLITGEAQLTAWFDANMLDKVVFNLLSNAFKFTKDKGLVHVYLSKSPDGKAAIIKVQDNGVGISREALSHAFEPFYQGDFENYKGSGIGLALSKELMQIHKGEIAVESEKGKGATFTLRLLLGNAHLKPEEMQVKEEHSTLFYEHEKIYLEEVEPEKHPAEALPEKNGSYEHTILIVEDYPDLRTFLATRLSKQYEIAEADNSQTALQQGFDIIPDLIICDRVMPGKDGLELTNIFKTDVRTSHIPIVLLTAKTAVDQQIEGMKSKADVYITKPFNVSFLEETIKSLLANRAKLKDHYTGELSVNLKSQTVNKPDRKFIHEFMGLVESNIDNEAFTAEDICKSMGISRVQLYRKVKALLDINVNDYILNTRLQKAKYLLQNEELTIGEIAYKVGFSTPAYFSTVFKSKFGITPTAFKEK